MILRDLLDAWPLALIAAGVALLLLFGRDPKADEHDLSDYHEPFRAVDSGRLMLRVEPVAQPVGGPAVLVDILPPAPPGMNAGSPLYAGMLFDTWHPEDPAEVAARWLREVGVEARAKAGIRPACATADRDMTGAFSWVRVA